eukprot:TRINITY_DN19157_c0_g1_i1.p1 TRINITY_DN19157_c0_g1~~TRINITY_DN19157_c0_g1_i1.p1  ORF type:complete len:253 (+),score=37.03 TRINITY_DN19157_c0_g1_i1:52-759(+)
MMARSPSPAPQRVESPHSQHDDEPHSVNVIDIATRLRFSKSARVLYSVSVALAACLILLTPMRGVNSWWYWALEGFLTGLFLSEITIKMVIQGPSTFLATSKANQVEAFTCFLCVVLFFASICGSTHQNEEGIAEALLITLRYTALLGRLCFFVRSTSAQTVSTSRVEIRSHDNHHIGVTVTPCPLSSSSLQRLDRFESTVWEDDDEHHDDMRKELLTHPDEEVQLIIDQKLSEP